MIKKSTNVDIMSPQMREAQFLVPGLAVNPFAKPEGEESGHGVFFGDLDGIGNVVIKPHVQLERAQNEHRRIEAIGRVGINTPNPVGIFEGNHGHYLITEKYPGLKTLTQQPIRLKITDPRLRSTLLPDVTLAAEGVGHMHLRGATHGDFQAKNAAMGPEREFIAMDLEKSQTNTFGEKGQGAREKDLYLLGSSLLLRGLMEDRSPSYRAGFLDAAILTPHASVIEPKESELPVDYSRVARAFEYTAKTNKIVPVTKM